MGNDKIDIGRNNICRFKGKLHGSGGLLSLGFGRRQVVGIGGKTCSAVRKKCTCSFTCKRKECAAFAEVDALSSFGKRRAGHVCNSRKRRKACVGELTKPVAAAGNDEIS